MTNILFDLFKEIDWDPEPETIDLMKVGGEDQVFLEQFKAFRSKMEHKADHLGWKAIGVTSTVASEGKTLTCAKIALGLALTKRKSVLLVDADNRKSDLTKGFGISTQPGLTEHLLGRASFSDIVRKGPVAGISMVSSGSLVSEPADLLAGNGFRDFVLEARRNFDTVLFDTPPILPVSDTMSMRDELDGFIFVLRLGYTPIEMFTQATEEIGGNKILGVVLNGARPKSDRFYGKYYGHYYTPLGITETNS